MRTINVNEILDNSKFNRFYFNTYMICLCIMIFDGYDMNIFGVIIPNMMQELQLSAAQIGIIASSALYGMIFGSVISGMIADKIGQKKAIILGIVVYSVFTGLIGFANSQTELIIYRFLAGFGLSGVVPNVIAYVAEYTPKNVRGFLLTVISIGINIGAMLAALLGILLISVYGWRMMFWIAFLPMIMAFFVYFFLPETMVQYVKKGDKGSISKTLEKANPEFVAEKDDEYKLNSVKSAQVPFISLFKHGLARNTILFWIAYFMNLFMIFALSTWLPKLLTMMGYSLGSSLWLLLVFNIGSILGTFFGGWAGPKYGYQRILILYYLIAAVLISTLAIKPTLLILSLVLFLAGTAVLGIQNLFNSYVSQCYPVTFRSTALGCGLGVGRLGGAIGPTIGGFLLASQVPMEFSFIVFAIPAVIGAIVVFASKDNTKKQFLEVPQ
ncbi:MFS transporter [Selenomonadales bacterium OttesenSCG-928-I06]|nr:MFS transporter [Selenomonadales bacterium OttesenSCG-928-I06]